MPGPTKPTIKKWKKVKLAGNLISDDGGNLDGLIGLEVLEEYDNGKVKRPVENNKKNKRKREDSDEENDFVDELQLDDDKPVKSKKKKKKQKLKGNGVAQQPGKFVLLRAEDKEDEDAIISEETTTKVDQLVGWNEFGIDNRILKGIAEKRFTHPTQIQSLTIPAAIMGKRDILGAAETGSGKTLAFGIPVLNGILYLKEKSADGIDTKLRTHEVRAETDLPPEEFDDDEIVSDVENSEDDETKEEARTSRLYALILTPTRELAVQVRDHIRDISQHTGIKIAAIFGGLAIAKQKRLLRQSPEIVVATPGRLWELVNEGDPHLSKIDLINFLVIDETDRMVEKGHFEELKLLLDRINTNPARKSQRQNFVFSATLTMVHDVPDYLQKINQRNPNRFLKQTPGQKLQSVIDMIGISQPKIVDITQNQGTALSLTECRIDCQFDEKDFYLYYFLLKHPGRTIVFCNSIDCVRRLAQLFGILECPTLPLHANMAQRQRLKNLERFRDNPLAVLVATDVAARGLDIPNVQHVIHYQVPRTSENYVHRSGRTARANNEGIAVLMMEPTEVRNYIKLCHTLGRSEDIPIFPVLPQELQAVKERVFLAREVDKLSLKTRRTQVEIGWKEKIAKEADMILDDDNDSSNVESDDEQTQIDKDKKLLKQKRAILTKLINKPVFPSGMSYKYPTSTGMKENLLEGDNIEKTAVNVMKSAIDDYKIDKQKRNSEKILNRHTYRKLGK